MCDCVGGVGRAALVTDWSSGDVVCSTCGVVVEGHIIDESPEWSFADGLVASRVGMPDAPLGTRLATRRTRKCAAVKDAPREIALREGLAQVDAFVSQLRLSVTGAVAVTAREVFRDYDDTKGVRADNRRHVAAAAVYFACKIERVGRELRLMSAVCDVDRKQFNAITAEFKECLIDRPYHEAMFRGLRPADLLDIFLDRLRLPPDVRKRVWSTAAALGRNLGDLEDCGRKPRTLCGGMLWVALRRLGVDVSKKRVSEACAVCQQTLDKVAALIEAAPEKSVRPVVT